MPEPTLEEVATGSGRLAQAGCGYLMFRAGLAWLRAWLATNEVIFVEHGDSGRVSAVMMECSDPDGEDVFWLMMGATVGHLLYSIDGETWYGTDVTYHSAEDTSRFAVVKRRVQRLREGHEDYGKPVKDRLEMPGAEEDEAEMRTPVAWALQYYGELTEFTTCPDRVADWRRLYGDVTELYL